MIVNETVCEACLPDAKSASKENILQFIEKFNDWELVEDVGFPQLKRVFKFQKFFRSTVIHQPSK